MLTVFHAPERLAAEASLRRAGPGREAGLLAERLHLRTELARVLRPTIGVGRRARRHRPEGAEGSTSFRIIENQIPAVGACEVLTQPQADAEAFSLGVGTVERAEQ